MPAPVRWRRTRRRGSRSWTGSFPGSDQLAKRNHLRLMPVAGGINSVRVVALLYRHDAELGLTLRTTTPVRFALEGRDEQMISIKLHSYHALTLRRERRPRATRLDDRPSPAY